MALELSGRQESLLTGTTVSGMTRAATATRMRVRTAAALRSITLRVFIASFVYPVAYLSPALFSRRHHMRNAYAEPTLLTDLDGAIRLAYVVKNMALPWSISTVTSAPTGEGIWRWQTLTQAVQVLTIWLFTRVTNATAAVNLLLLIGWALSGFAAYHIARRMGSATWAAACAGLLVQLLPSLPIMAANYTSYVFICVPLFTLWSAIEFSASATDRRFRTMVGTLAFTAFFDGYWFFFCLSAVAIVIAIRQSEVRRWYAGAGRGTRALALATLSGPFLMVACVFSLDQFVARTSTSRTLEIADTRLIDAGLRSLPEWARTTMGGVGPIVVLLSIVRVTRRSSLKVSERLAMLVTVLFVLLASQTGFTTDLASVSPLSHFARYVMPGVRFFQRSALIAEAFLCIFAIREVEDLVRKIDRHVVRRLTAVALAAALVVTLQPMSGRAVQRIGDDYAELRSIVASFEDPVVAALPYTKVGRSWMELSFLDVPSVNPLYASEVVVETNVAASQGPGALAAYLADRGTTHLFMIRGDEALPITYTLEAPRFVRVGTQPTSGFELGPMVFDIYEVHPQPGDRYCGPCGVGDQMTLVRGAEIDGTLSLLEVLSDEVRAWWLHGQRGSLTIETVELPAFTSELHLTLGGDPCGTSRLVTVRHDGQTWGVPVNATQHATISIPLTDRSITQPVTIEASGRPCRIDTDPRDFMVQVFFPTLA